ncbi:hypothetical protein OUZ56_021599 [Daphnia magna]|uniref:Uncharacterized protein n=1 Tax=Daphnia magna TaxID=35525 RepID=A0ABR0ATY8_9CRUS|nr:hypothetical protein OUZ56_021599 [Daphnia magna]
MKKLEETSKGNSVQLTKGPNDQGRLTMLPSTLGINIKISASAQCKIQQALAKYLISTDFIA